MVLATHRADVNGVIRKHLGVRKISFAAQDDAVSSTGMEYGGITPIGVPADWPILVDEAVAQAGPVVIGSGLRASKILIDGTELANRPTATVLALASPA
jgi:prolyl-tRNA editing enzyme YbaK/EbsC (Cys-tRNA(Pro) deacylase)